MELLKTIATGVISAVLILTWLSRRMPRVRWLQAFRFSQLELSPAQRERVLRRSDFYAGAKLILLGLTIPPGYVALSVMTFSSPTAIGFTLSLAAAVLCIGLGAAAIASSRRRHRAGRSRVLG